LTTITSVAQRILDENGYTLTDFKNLTLTILEYKIDDAIDYVNLHAGISIADLTGSAETKSLVATEGQILVIKWLTNMMLRAYKEKGTQAGLGNLSLSYLVNDSDTHTSQLILKEIERLKEPPIYITNDPVPTDS
jgi:hypothetical protein